jgi:DNA-binding response OmpR family regulator
MSVTSGAVGSIDILLVEDNAGDLLLQMKFLKESKVKCRVNIVRDGEMALDYLKRINGFERAWRPDLVLLDLGLPRLGGLEVLKEIKSDESLRMMPVIVFTSSNDAMDALSVYQLKADYLMIKPCDLSQFAASMRYLEEVWLKVLFDRKQSRDGDWIV